MNPLYEKEKKKVLLLLLLGFILDVAFSIKVDAGLDDILSALHILIPILLYPVGLVYGGKQMWNLYHNLRRGDRIAHIHNGGYTTIMISVVWIGLAFSLTLCFGWIFGVINAIKTLIEYKKQV